MVAFNPFSGIYIKYRAKNKVKICRACEKLSTCKRVPITNQNSWLMKYLTIIISLIVLRYEIGYTQDAQVVQRLTNVIDSYPMLSPRGDKIIFQSNRTGQW